MTTCDSDAHLDALVVFLGDRVLCPLCVALAEQRAAKRGEVEAVGLRSRVAYLEGEVKEARAAARCLAPDAELVEALRAWLDAGGYHRRAVEGT